MTIGELIAVEKTLNFPARPKIKSNKKHREFDIDAVAACDGKFTVYLRMNVELFESFSIGLRYTPEGGGQGSLLLRLNGDHGSHGNEDGSWFEGGAHLHAPTPAESILTPEPGWEARHASLLRAGTMTTLPDAWHVFRNAANIRDEEDRGLGFAMRMWASGAQGDLGL